MILSFFYFCFQYKNLKENGKSLLNSSSLIGNQDQSRICGIGRIFFQNLLILIPNLFNPGSSCWDGIFSWLYSTSFPSTIFSPKYKSPASRKIISPYRVVIDEILKPPISRAGETDPICSIALKAS